MDYYSSSPSSVLQLNSGENAICKYSWQEIYRICATIEEKEKEKEEEDLMNNEKESHLLLQILNRPEEISSEEVIANDLFWWGFKVNMMLNFGFASYLRKWEREKVILQYQLAYLSTLGGAYHLCARPRVALHIAKRQEVVGRALGSWAVIIRAKVFQATNYFLLGNSRKSRIIFKLCHKLVNEQRMLDLEKFISASEGWLTRNSSSSSESTLTNLPES